LLYNKFKYLISCLITAFCLASCGFTPLYSTNNTKSFYNSDVKVELAQIKIKHIADRFGQQIRNELLDNLTPLGQPKKPKYILEVFMEEEPRIIEQALRDDVTATRETMKISMLYKLKKGKEIILEGDSVAFTSYNILSNPYSTTVSKEDAYRQAANIIANDIALRLAAFFHSEIN
jgi:LPS-assembly lipoprotein